MRSVCFQSIRAMPCARCTPSCGRADDLSDDESMSLDARRTAMAGMARTTGVLRRAGGVVPTIRCSWQLSDAQKRFMRSLTSCWKIWFVGRAWTSRRSQAGTSVMEDASLGAMQVRGAFRSMKASMSSIATAIWSRRLLGLVCIKVFGYSDGRAEKLAEETGSGVSAHEYPEGCERRRGTRARVSAA